MTAIPTLASGDPVEAELAAIAVECRTLATRLAQLTGQTLQSPPPATEPLTATQVRRYLRARRLRGQLLPAELFADPAWDLLLDLYASELEGHSVSITSACIAAAVPPTTALRWLGKIEQLGLVERQDDRTDSRRSFVRLTGPGREGIRQWLAQASWPERPGDRDCASSPGVS